MHTPPRRHAERSLYGWTTPLMLSRLNLRLVCLLCDLAHFSLLIAYVLALGCRLTTGGLDRRQCEVFRFYLCIPPCSTLACDLSVVFLSSLSLYLSIYLSFCLSFFFSSFLKNISFLQFPFICFFFPFRIFCDFYFIFLYTFGQT